MRGGQYTSKRRQPENNLGNEKIRSEKWRPPTRCTEGLPKVAGGKGTGLRGRGGNVEQERQPKFSAEQKAFSPSFANALAALRLTRAPTLRKSPRAALYLSRISVQACYQRERILTTSDGCLPIRSRTSRPPRPAAGVAASSEGSFGCRFSTRTRGRNEYSVGSAAFARRRDRKDLGDCRKGHCAVRRRRGVLRIGDCGCCAATGTVRAGPAIR